MAKQKTYESPTIETVKAGVAAVDIGSREHMTAVKGGTNLAAFMENTETG